MNVLDYYDELLRGCGMHRKEGDQIGYRYTEDTFTVTGKRVYVPTDTTLTSKEHGTYIAFHPLCESLVRIPSKLHNTLMKAADLSMQMMVTQLVDYYLRCFADTTKHSLFTPEMSAMCARVSLLGTVDDKTLTVWEKLRGYNSNVEVFTVQVKRQVKTPSGGIARYSAEFNRPLVTELERVINAPTRKGAMIGNVDVSNCRKNILPVILDVINIVTEKWVEPIYTNDTAPYTMLIAGVVLRNSDIATQHATILPESAKEIVGDYLYYYALRSDSGTLDKFRAQLPTDEHCLGELTEREKQQQKAFAENQITLPEPTPAATPAPVATTPVTVNAPAPAQGPKMTTILDIANGGVSQPTPTQTTSVLNAEPTWIQTPNGPVKVVNNVAVGGAGVITPVAPAMGQPVMPGYGFVNQGMPQQMPNESWGRWQARLQEWKEATELLNVQTPQGTMQMTRAQYNQWLQMQQQLLQSTQQLLQPAQAMYPQQPATMQSIIQQVGQQPQQPQPLYNVQTPNGIVAMTQLQYQQYMQQQQQLQPVGMMPQQPQQLITVQTPQGATQMTLAQYQQMYGQPPQQPQMYVQPQMYTQPVQPAPLPPGLKPIG